MTLAFFVLTHYRRVTDGRTDRKTVTLGGLRAVNCEISLAGAYVTVW